LWIIIDVEGKPFSYHKIQRDSDVTKFNENFDVEAFAIFQNPVSVPCQTSEWLIIEWDSFFSIHLHSIEWDCHFHVSWNHHKLVLCWLDSLISVTCKSPLKPRKCIGKRSAGVSSLGLSFPNLFNCWVMNASATVHGFNRLHVKDDPSQFEYLSWNICFFLFLFFF
jgi:hypothetical protein